MLFASRYSAEERIRIREVEEKYASDRRLRWYNTCVKVVQFPAYVLDLLDSKGKPDHAKIFPALTLFWMMGIITWAAIDADLDHHPVPHWPPFQLMALVAAFSFLSPRVLQAFFRRTQISVKDETKHTIEQVDRHVVEERGPTGEPPTSLPPTGAQVE